MEQIETFSSLNPPPNIKPHLSVRPEKQNKQLKGAKRALFHLFNQSLILLNAGLN